MRIDGVGGGGYSGYDLSPVRKPKELEPTAASPRDEPQSILSPEEAAYFAELERIGPLTYGRRSRDAAVPPPALGQRVDVRA